MAHNIGVQLVFSWAPKWKVVRKCESKHWLSCGADGRRAVGRSVYGRVITKFSGMGRFTKLWGSAYARASRARGSSAIIRGISCPLLSQLAAVCPRMPQEKNKARRLRGGLGGPWRDRLLMGFVDLSQAVKHLRVIFIREKCQIYVRLKLLNWRLKARAEALNCCV